MKEQGKEWLCIIAATFFLPTIITLLLSGTVKEEKNDSGICIVTEQGEKMDMEEFLLYMIAGQIDLDAEKETLKAQAVIGRTNLLRELGEKTEIQETDLSVVYLSPEKFANSFGDRSLEEMKKKIQQAVDATKGQSLVYDNQYIEALYHPVSIGTTISSKEYFGKERPYLISVESSQDVESEEYMTMKSWRIEEILSLLQKEGKAQFIEKDQLLDEIKIEEKTENGYVKSVKVGAETISGEEWKNIFQLNSTNFYLEGQENTLRMIVLGKGHGIGMSQFGANELAKEGWNYEEILKKYYPGVSIRERK